MTKNHRAVLSMDPRQFSTLVAIMSALRDPDGGCPWDLAQSFATIAPYTLEEAYEVADAIAQNDMAALKDELGDLLLQPVYHAQLAKDQHAFAIEDVIEAVCTKMIRRHPHVFGDDVARAAPLAKGFWEEAKAKERANGEHKRTLDGIAISLPAATRGVKLQAKAAKVGFDWPDVSHVFDKVVEELDELKEAPREHRAEEFGDLMFAMVNIARHYGIDPETALRGANAKFERRFRHIEVQLAQRGKSPQQSNLEEMDAFWNDAKAKGL
jgi:nucleoside triphosphate diphosphatase